MGFSTGGGGSSAITGASDVTISGIADGQTIVYDAVTQKFKNSSIVASSGAGSFALSVPGTLTAGSGIARYPITFTGFIKGVTVGVASVASADIVVDVNKNGTKLYSNQTTRPRIVAGQNLGSKVVSNVAVAPGDYITVDRDQVGAASAASVVASSAATTSGAQTIVIPRPAEALAGDVHIASLITTVGGSVGGSGSQPATAITAPTGWTEIGAPTRQATNVNSRDLEVHHFWWRDDGTQSTWTFTVTTPSSNAYATGRVTTTRGAGGSGTPIDTYGTSAAAATSDSPVAPSLTARSANSILLAIFANSNSPTSPVMPAGMTQIGPIDKFIVAYQILTAAGSTGAKTLTSASTSPTSHWIQASILITTAGSASGVGSDLTVVVDYSA